MNLDSHRVGRAAREWLVEVHAREESSDEVPLRTCLPLVVSLWLCEVGLKVDPQAEATRVMAARLREQLDGRTLQEVASELVTCDSVLVFVSALLLKRLNIPSRNMTAFVTAMAGMMEPAEEGGGGSAVAGQFLLAQAGLCDPPRLPSFISRTRWPQYLLEVDRRTTIQVCQDLMVAAGFGTRRPEPTQAIADVATVLPIWTLYYLRRYDLTLAAQLLRACNYVLGAKDRAVKEGLYFLAAQQLPSGKFGCLVSTADADGSPEDVRAADRDLYLPLTLTCLWTIAETSNRRFRLLQPARAKLS